MFIAIFLFTFISEASPSLSYVSHPFDIEENDNGPIKPLEGYSYLLFRSKRMLKSHQNEFVIRKYLLYNKGKIPKLVYALENLLKEYSMLANNE